MFDVAVGVGFVPYQLDLFGAPHFFPSVALGQGGKRFLVDQVSLHGFGSASAHETFDSLWSLVEAHEFG